MMLFSLFQLCVFAQKQVFMKIRFKDEFFEEQIRTLIFDLYDEEVPLTVENFYRLIEGVDIEGKHRTYKKSKFHRVIENFIIQGGDITRGDGTGSISIYNEQFKDENLKIKHKPGCLSMANSGPDSNGSQFFITVSETAWLDGRHVVFGQITPETYKYAVEISKTKTNDEDRPLFDVSIIACGDYSKKKQEIYEYL